MTELTGLLSNIQKYSTKDGPGIRSTAFLIGCNLRCRWCANPEAMYPGKKIMYQKHKCQKCGTCVSYAANHAITLGPEGCIIDREQCTNLRELVDICNYDAYEEKGMVLTPQELYTRLIKDKVFYDTSGGGVTFSGGEPFLQKDFLLATIKLLKQDGVHVAVDTAGLWDYDAMQEVIALADLILYDIKAYDSEIHQHCVQTDNAVILKNAKRLAADGKDMIVRLLLVPGWNDDAQDVKRRVDFVASLGPAVQQLDILKYHKLGIGKYLSLGLEYPLPDVPECDDAAVEKVVEYAQAKGLKVTIGG